MNIFETFYTKVSSHLNESVINDDNYLNFEVDFFLEAAKTPWKDKEDWLTSNPKVDKNKLLKSFKKDGKDVVFETYLINLLPSKQSGLNLCMCASKACAATCLHTSGNVGALVGKTVGRLRKTWFFVMEREKALEQIIKQIAAKKNSIDKFNAKSDSVHKQLVIRLNGTQDIVWNNIKTPDGRTIFEVFPDVVFYDYTKLPSQMAAFNNQELPSNYHLTLSYGGNFTNTAKKTLSQGKNLAVAFGPGKLSSLDKLVFPASVTDLFKSLKYPMNVNTYEKQEEYRNQIRKELLSHNAYPSDEELSKFAGQLLFPGLFHCYEVIDGDRHDARFLDDHIHGAEDENEITSGYSPITEKKNGLIVGLTAKGNLAFDSYNSEGSGWSKEATGFMVGPSDPGLNPEACDTLFINDPAKGPELIEKTNLYKKVSKAILIMRNFDARHVHKDKKNVDMRKTEPRLTNRKAAPVSGKPKANDLIQTFPTAKNRVPDELNKLYDAIQVVFSGKSLSKKIGPRTKQIISSVQSLKEYLLDPEVRKKLTDPEFVAKAKAAGIDINFDALHSLLQHPESAYTDPAGQKTRVPLSVLPANLVKKLTTQESFGFTDFVSLKCLNELLQN